MSNRARSLAAAAGVATVLAAVFASPVAAASGQIGEAWGKAGSGTGAFVTPGMLGVDPSDGSVYTGEEKDASHYRIQKFTSSGEFKASVEVPRLSGEVVFNMRGIAVDPVLDRVYLLEGCHLKKPATGCKLSSSFYGASRILAFSTEPSGTALVPASPATLAVPGSEEAIYEPQTIAVDPSSHDLVILGEDFNGHLLVQRIGSDGTPGARYVDTADELRVPGKKAESLAVGPDGTAYTLTGGPNLPGAPNTRAWQLPASLSQVEPVPGFAEAAESEGWTTGLLAPKNSAFVGGPQLAVSPDGGTLYWKEVIELGDDPETDPSNVLVRGYSLAEDKTSVLYGNGSNAKKRCLIQTPAAGIATTGEKLVVFDYGPGEESTAFGNRVMTFGPGGSDCRSPVAKFTANGKAEGEEVTVEKGTEVTFDSSGSETLGLAATELDWDFGDGSEQKVTGSPPAKTVKHTFSSAGTYQVTLRMKLEQATETANFGNPLPVTRLIKVTGGSLAKLTVTKAGSGFGTVTSSPAGIACGADCDQEFETSKEVTLTAKAVAGSKFTGWSGSGCSGTGTCNVTMSAAKAVTASFDPVPKQKLTVKKAGSGTGVVTSAPSGIDCRKDCTQEYEEGKEVTLKAVPVEGTNSTFTGWSGGGCSGTESCKVTMSAAKEVTATFVAGGTFEIEVEIAGNSGGTVASIPSGVLCPSTCKAPFAKGLEVELVQGANEGSTFVKWGGACSGSGVCKLTGEAGDVKKVTAEFESPGPFNLSVAKIGSGSGSGKVSSAPAGISCSPTCEAEFAKGKEVTLTATVTEGAEAEFVKWGGDCAGSEKTCKVTMSKAKSVTAEFKSTAVDKAQLKVNKTGTGSGKVTSSPGGIDCGSTCAFKFAKEANVELTAVADAGSEFVKWSGSGCSGTGICKVKMSADKEVTAEFKPNPTFKLTIKKAGGGSGKVTSSPGGIDCGGACEFEFEKNTKVVLSQSADSSSEFVRWIGACSGSAACEVTMSTAKTVTAEFKPAPPTSTPPPPTPTTPTPTPTPPAPKLTPKQKALAKCKKKSGKARAKCIKKVKAKYKKRGSKRRRLKDSG